MRGSWMTALALVAAVTSGAGELARTPDGTWVERRGGPPGPEQVAPEEFGTADWSIAWLTRPDFAPRGTTSPLEGDGAFDYFWATEAYTWAGARIEVPNGALLDWVEAYGSDTHQLEDVSLHFCRRWVDSPTGANPGGDCPDSAWTSGAPGGFCLSLNPGRTIRYREDIDSDGTIETVIPVVYVGFEGNTSSSTQVLGVRYLWKRQVSPAPAVATFTDVPPSYWAFQHVEALADSGITAGCGGGNFCPDQPVTRSQMAVFLSKALGLHWPSF